MKTPQEKIDDLKLTILNEKILIPDALWKEFIGWLDIEFDKEEYESIDELRKEIRERVLESKEVIKEVIDEIIQIVSEQDICDVKNRR